MKQMAQQNLPENNVIEISDDEDEEKVDLSSPASNSGKFFGFD